MKSLARSLVMILCCTVLASCAVDTYTLRGTEAAKAGRYAEAEPLLLQAIREGDQTDLAWTNLGVLYKQTGRVSQGYAAVTMGARYGNAHAQTLLVSWKQPVPRADLAPKVMSDAETLLIMTSGFAKGWNGVTPTPASSPMPVTCNSMRFRGGDYTTTCQ